MAGREALRAKGRKRINVRTRRGGHPAAVRDYPKGLLPKGSSRRRRKRSRKGRSRKRA